jgi:hypothetical protein
MSVGSKSDAMKNFKLSFVIGLFAVMGLVLLAEEPQGGGAHEER